MIRKKLSKIKIKKERVIEFFTFVFLFAFQVILNVNEIVPRSLPDEIGAMATAARIGGCDWSYVLSQSGLYYGFGSTIFLFPIFRIVHDPLLIYQVFLAWGALLRTLPVFFCFSISRKVLGIKNEYLIVLINVISILGAPTRSTNIDNEPMLIFIAWVLFYLLILLQTLETSKNKNIYTIVYAIVLCVSFTVHTRAYIYLLVSMLVFGLYHISKKKALVNYKIFGIMFFITFLLTHIAKTIVQKTVYTSDAYLNDELLNTASSVSTRMIDTITDIFLTPKGVLSAITLLFSNTWIVCVFSVGMIFFTLLTLGYLLFNHRMNRKIRGSKFEPLILPAIFAILIFLISILGLTILWITSPIEVWDNGKDLTRGFFYLRYIGNSFGIILYVGCILMLYFNVPNRFYVFLILLQLFTAKFVINGTLSIAIENGNVHGDWFGYFAPLTLGCVKWNSYIQDVKYYLVPTLVSCIFICMFCFFNTKKKQIISLLLVAFLFIFQYSYSTFNWDAPFSHSENYYGAIDGVYKLRKDVEEFFIDVEEVYYCNEVYGRQFLMQFVLYDKSLITSYPSQKEDNMVIVFTNYEEFVNNISFEMSNFLICKIDSNEYIATNNKNKKEILINKKEYQIIN